MREYQTIVADPPWDYRSPGEYVAPSVSGLGGRASSKFRYGSMRLPDICALRPPSAANAHLYLWFTNSFAVEAHEVARAWGFEPKTIITWVKTKRGNPAQPSMKMGYYFRGATEHVLFGVKGSLRLRAERAIPTAFMHPRIHKHSEKPAAFMDLVEECSPGPYLELFCRNPRPGWDAWGNEIESTVEIGAVP